MPGGSFAIYIVEKGNPQSFLDGVGRVHEYAVGEAFGELEALTHQPRAYSVLVNAMGKPAELMVFPGDAVETALSNWTDDERKEHYEALSAQYDESNAMRKDPHLVAEVRELWNIMVRHSSHQSDFVHSRGLIWRVRLGVPGGGVETAHRPRPPRHGDTGRLHCAAPAGRQSIAVRFRRARVGEQRQLGLG